MGMKSRRKGKVGEREFAALCRLEGYDARRGQQYSGVEGEDVIGLPGVHVEVKRVERLNIHEAMSQSLRDAAGKPAIVAHRRSRGPWLITMPAEQWFELFREWEAGQAVEGSQGEAKASPGGG